jgi:hypothetical protein
MQLHRNNGANTPHTGVLLHVSTTKTPPAIIAKPGELKKVKCPVQIKLQQVYNALPDYCTQLHLLS